MDSITGKIGSTQYIKRGHLILFYRYTSQFLTHNKTLLCFKSTRYTEVIKKPNSETLFPFLAGYNTSYENYPHSRTYNMCNLI